MEWEQAALVHTVYTLCGWSVSELYSSRSPWQHDLGLKVEQVRLAAWFWGPGWEWGTEFDPGLHLLQEHGTRFCDPGFRQAGEEAWCRM